MAEAKPDLVELIVGGRVHSGWETVRVVRGIDSLAHSFSLGVAERWPGQPERFILEAGAQAKIAIAGETIISGWIDTLDAGMEAESHSLSIAGRSRAADLIDCSAIATPGSWTGRTIVQIAAELAAPFGITVTSANPGAPFKSFAIQPGETVFECIERMAKQRGLLIISTADGNVELINPKPDGAGIRIKTGDFESIDARHDVTQRFSRYLLKGQAAGDDDHHGKAVSQVKAEASDPGVKRNRPLLIVSDEQANIASLATRAKWEASVRAAKAQSVTVTMAGFRDPKGALWKPRVLIDLDAPETFVTSQMLVAEVAYVLDESGSHTELTLAFPEAYAPEPVPDDAQASKITRKGKA